MANIFKFKQFDVDQTGCTMKINTDGVLLGALTQANTPLTILDIGTGTGVIALMLAQKFPHAFIDAVEIDVATAATAGSNFNRSAFANRLKVYTNDFKSHLQSHPDKKYDLIISNPPFYINSLTGPVPKANLAKHAGNSFFFDLIIAVKNHLTTNGACWLILPVPTADLVNPFAQKAGLYLQQTIGIYSFATSEPHRVIIVLGLSKTKTATGKFIIYDAPKVYSKQYQESLQDFFTIF